MLLLSLAGHASAWPARLATGRLARPALLYSEGGWNNGCISVCEIDFKMPLPLETPIFVLLYNNAHTL